MDEKKEMYRDLVLKTTINLYANYGIRGVSMGQIAGALQISKKTLYAEFGSKEELLCTCMDFEAVRLLKMLETVEQETTNPVETLVVITYNLYKYKFYYCSSFQKDIVRFKTANLKLHDNFAKLAERYSIYLRRGCEEGYLQQGSDVLTIANLLIELLMTSDSSEKLFLMFTFLRGLCTTKGLEVIYRLTLGSEKEASYSYN